MSDPQTVAIIAIACGASLFMAWTIGAGSSGSTPFTPAVGANAISIMRAGLLVGILGFAGAVLQGANVANAVGTSLVGGVTLTSIAATILLLLAASLVAIGIFTGYPIATAFTVTGAVIGVGLGLGGSPVWSAYLQIAALWLLTPFVGGGLAYLTAQILRSESVPERYSVPLLGGIVGLVLANIPFTVLGSSSGGESVSTFIASQLPMPQVASLGLSSLIIATSLALVLALDMNSDVENGQQHFLLGLGALVAFSAGGSQVGLAIGPLLAAFRGTTLSLSIPLLVLLIFGGFGLLIGSWTGAPRMIKAISQDYSSLGPRRSIAALIPSFAIAQTAILFGIPVSFNEIIVSAIAGSGYAAGNSAVSRRKAINTVAAWIGSFIFALVFSYGVYAAISIII